ncbi:RnfABCDGE type electron transport complex subunit G [Ostreibacterium oceani]|uniref:Ion-translocating oxidoreductase complex subunit G n=1 Tax=Ostreibacterium oceani TaxID=2654998 RepID=A0A6N7ETT1_9GAMM|nr:RnfABCDGE type electron transport complex subunit G [Ostreibacterium oceani]MPV85832.1 RnfABCDGE type electron transport complex subunit G [Ostreibacterium oceani]
MQNNQPTTPRANSASRILLRLVIITTVSLGGVFLAYQLSQSRIEESRQRYLSQQLVQLLPAGRYDDILLSRQQTPDFITYHACTEAGIAFTLLEIATEKAYNGRIELLVAINHQSQSITQIRPLFHQETPGLGDQIDVDKSDWLQQFAGKITTPSTHVALRHKGGRIDAITGATITSHAISHVMQQTIKTLNQHPLPTPDCTKRQGPKYNQQQLTLSDNTH